MLVIETEALSSRIRFFDFQLIQYCIIYTDTPETNQNWNS
jgi:hypothetical protein